LKLVKYNLQSKALSSWASGRRGGCGWSSVTSTVIVYKY